MKRCIQFSMKNALTMLLVVPLIIFGGIYSLQTLLIGALIGLYMMKEPIGMPAMIGLLMLN